METEKDLIRRIFDEKAKDDSNSKDLARTLELLSKTVFGDINRFVFELLQNADDAATEDNRSINVEFRLLNNYIVFSHNGEHFSPNDVEGISSVAGRQGNKDKAQEKTGYKGIGFKSVFGSSTYAHIISGPFSFRFDKDFHHWDGMPEHYPWQVIPIWTDEPEQEVQTKLDRSRVTTILNVSDRDNLRKEILEVFEDCQIILFLRRVSRITFYDHDDTVFDIEKSQKEDGTVELYKNAQLHSSWKLNSAEIQIPKELTDQLMKLDDSQCPQKLREATKTKLTFAAPINDGKIVPLGDSVIYSYLPTKASLDFAFLINGDFLMDARRTELLNGVWNEFLFNKIAHYQLIWVLKLQEQKYRYEVFKLIRTKFLGPATGFKKAFNDQLAISAGTVEFVSDNDGLTYHAVSNCIVDQTRFCDFFSESLLRDYMNLDKHFVIVDYRYNATNKLIDLGAKSFGPDDVFKMISHGFFSGWEESHSLSRFLHYGAQNFNLTSWDRNCQEAQFLADEDEILRSPKAIFFPFKDDKELPDIDQSELYFVHKKILDIYESAGDETLFDWFHFLGVREPTETEIAKKSILPMIRKDKVTEENSVKLVQLLVRVHSKKEFADSDYEEMSKMKLISSQGFDVANECYLPPIYGGDPDLLVVLPDSEFVSDIYTSDISEEEVPHFRTFFKKIGCSDTISVVAIEEAIERRTLEKLYPESTEFFSWLERKGIVNSIYHIYRYSGQHSYARFTRVDFLTKLVQPVFAKFFWDGVFSNWDVFTKITSGGTYYYRGGSVTTISFIQYYAIEHAIVPCTDGQCRKGSDIFAPTLKNIVGSYMPVADFPTSMTASQRDFLGLKKVISTTECLELLSKLSNEPITPETVKQIHAIYGQMVGLSGDNDEVISAEIAKWKINGRLLATDNTFQPANSLRCFDVAGLEKNADTSFFIKLQHGLSNNEKMAFCKLFDIQIVSSGNLEFVADNSEEDFTLPTKLKEKLPYFSLISSRDSLEDFLVVFRKMSRILVKTKFYRSDSLSYVLKGEDAQLLFENNIHCVNLGVKGFHFAGNWQKLRILYELISPICDLFSIKDFEREIQFLMLAKEDEVIDWLDEGGYDVAHLEELKAQTELFVEEDAQPEPQVIDTPDFEYGIQFIEQPFVPDVHPDEIDWSNIQPTVKEYINPVSLPTQQYNRPTDERFAADVGRWTEEFVFKYLKEHPETFTEVNWVNQEEESNLPYDFECLENGHKLFIDAKGTTSREKVEIYVSVPEWRFIFEKGEQYSIFRVFRAGYSDCRFERIDGVSKKITQGEVLPNPIGLIV